MAHPATILGILCDLLITDHITSFIVTYCATLGQLNPSHGCSLSYN